MIFDLTTIIASPLLPTTLIVSPLLLPLLPPPPPPSTSSAGSFRLIVFFFFVDKLETLLVFLLILHDGTVHVQGVVTPDGGILRDSSSVFQLKIQQLCPPGPLNKNNKRQGIVCMISSSISCGRNHYSNHNL